MDQQIFLRYNIQRNNFWVQFVETYPLIPIFAKNHGLTMFQLDDIFRFCFGISGIVERTIIENDTILINFNK